MPLYPNNTIKLSTQVEHYPPQYIQIDMNWNRVNHQELLKSFMLKNPQCQHANIINCTSDDSWRSFVHTFLGQESALGSGFIVRSSDTAVSPRGIIGLYDNCRLHRDFGCSIKTLPPELLNRFNSKLPKYQSIILLSAKFGEASWHFPIEQLSALANFPEDLLEKSLLHVTAKTSYVLQWLAVVGISESKVVTGYIHAEELYIPRTQCGAALLSGLNWLRNQTFATLAINTVQDLSEPRRNRTIVIIVRTKTRVIEGTPQIIETAKAFGDEYGYNIHIHSDALLPPLKDQIELFSRADILVGPHGSGFLFMIYTPKNACVIDYTPSHIGTPCYPKLAYTTGVNYMHFAETGNNINTTVLRNSMETCHYYHNQ